MATNVIDQKTAANGLPLPHPQNELSDDVARIRDALIAVDALLASKANSTDVAAEFERLIGSAPGALDTLKELADALSNNPEFSAYVSAEIQRLDQEISSGNANVDKVFRRLRNKQVCGLDF